MSMSKRDFEKLQRMQELCTALEDDILNAKKFAKQLKAMEKRRSELESLYHKHWQRLAEPRNLTAAQKETLDGMLPNGRYSILGEDTIWDTLAGVRFTYI